jgi:hypothetical protein
MVRRMRRELQRQPEGGRCAVDLNAPIHDARMAVGKCGQ